VCCFTNKVQVNRAGPPERSPRSNQRLRLLLRGFSDAGHSLRPLASPRGELLCCLPEIDNEVIELFLIFDAAEDHFLARDKLVGIGEILLERIFVPDHP
jgi:hypothetical protein